jgi:uncharacterized membrane protein YhaH (DUF805 family)
MDFRTAIKTCFRKIAVFEGRASRAEFFPITFAVLCVTILFHKTDYHIQSLLSIILIILTVSLQVRRFHDVGFSGWIFLLFSAAILVARFVADFSSGIADFSGYGNDQSTPMIALITMLGLSVAYIVLVAWPGTKGPNKYGEDPLVSASQDAAQVNYAAPKTHALNPTGTDNLALVERLYALRQKDILTDAEFEREKRRILAG